MCLTFISFVFRISAISDSDKHTSHFAYPDFFSAFIYFCLLSYHTYHKTTDIRGINRIYYSHLSAAPLLRTDTSAFSDSASLIVFYSYSLFQKRKSWLSQPRSDTIHLSAGRMQHEPCTNSNEKTSAKWRRSLCQNTT